MIKIVNDTTTLNGALTELGETIATNISAKGVTASASDGLTTLASKISQIQTGGGGASNVVQGTFTTGSTRATAETVTLNYTGNGYPIACMVFVNGGLTGNTTWYNLIAPYDIGIFITLKRDIATTPTYSQESEENFATVLYFGKNSSTTDPNGFVSGSSSSAWNWKNSSVAQYGYVCIVLKSATEMKITTGNNTSSTRGLTPSTTYAYIVIYSE